MTTFPAFYDSDKVGTLFTPNTSEAASAGQAAGLPPATADHRRVMLLLVDPQVDFIHPDGALSVPGAVADTQRTIEWVFRNADRLTTIAASLDSHVPIQIFFPTWWIGPDGKHPEPFTVISGDDVERNRWTPVFEPEWSRHYVHTLEANARKQLMIWPYHTMIGTPGHAITPALYEAITYHAAARQSQPHLVLKGSIPTTEHYSLLEPEVKVRQHLAGNLNTEFLGMLETYDVIYVAGQAKSHCVLETVASILRYYANQPEQIAKWRILTDAMSSVPHPDIDFEAMAQAAFDRFAQKGLSLVTTADPIEEPPHRAL